MKKIGTGKLRQQNAHILLQLLVHHQTATKKQLAQESQLTVATVGTILNDFVKKQIVYENQRLLSPMGRPSIQYSLQADYFHLLCLYVQQKNQRNYVRCEVINALFQVVRSWQKTVDHLTVEQLVEDVAWLVQEDKHIQMIGIGVPAIVSYGILIESDISGWKGTPLQTLVEQRTGISTLVKNDMNYTAYGYYRRHQLHQDICCITYPQNSGPGCGSVINGQILEGQNGIAGEILYLPFFEFLKKKSSHQYSLEQVALSIVCVASILNPSIVVLTGEFLHQDDLAGISQYCLQYLPLEFMPQILYRQDYEEDYMDGLKTLTMQFFLEHLSDY